MAQEDLDLTEKEMRLCAEMQEWLEIGQVLQEFRLPLGVRNAWYKLTHCNYEFTFSTIRRGLPVTVKMPDGLGGKEVGNERT